jgi:hypothetical protein
MTHTPGTVGLIVISGVLLLAAIFCANGQSTDASPSDLIKLLTRSDGQNEYGLRIDFSCGQAWADDQRNRKLADALVKNGVSALPDIEKALDAIGDYGEQSKFAVNAQWLLEAYARIKGHFAFPRLRAMLDNRHFAFLQFALDDSVATSLGLTSFLSASRLLGVPRSCNPIQEPRDTLDQFVVAWVRGDRQYLEATLGPEAKAALQSLIGNRTWASVRAGMWRGRSGHNVAVGYRFETAGWWSEREQPLQVRLDTRSPVNPEVDTAFTNASGVECGRRRVKFVKSGGVRVSYLIVNSDPEDLLQLITSCAAK